MNAKESFEFIDKLANDIYNEKKAKSSIFTLEKIKYYDINGDTAINYCKELYEITNRINNKEDAKKDELYKEIKKIIDKYAIYKNLINNVNEELSFDDSIISFAKAALDVLNAYENSEIYSQTAREKLLNIRKAFYQKYGSNKMHSLISSLESEFFNRNLEGKTKKIMKDIKTYINELEIKKEIIKSIKLIDLLSLFEDKKQYIEIYSIGFGEEDLEKIEKYKGIVDMDLLITKSFIDKVVKVVKSSYDFENNLNIKNIFLSLINKL